MRSPPVAALPSDALAQPVATVGDGLVNVQVVGLDVPNRNSVAVADVAGVAANGCANAAVDLAAPAAEVD